MFPKLVGVRQASNRPQTRSSSSYFVSRDPVGKIGFRHSSHSAATQRKPLNLNSMVISPDGIEGNKNKLRNMIFLHGLLGSHSNWRTLANIVTKECLVNAHLLDARNHGASPHDPEMNYDAMSTDLHEYIVRNSLGRVTLLGHSMGGKWAVNFATHYPELVEKLIVVDIAPVKYTGWTGIQNILDWMNNIDLSTLKTRKEADAAAQGTIGDPLTRGFVLQNLIPDATQKQEFVWRVNAPVLRQSLPNLMVQPVGERAKYYGPTLYVKGAKSAYVSPRYEEEIAAVTPDFNVSSVDDAGHYVHAEKPKEFLSKIIPFIVHHK